MIKKCRIHSRMASPLGGFIVLGKLSTSLFLSFPNSFLLVSFTLSYGYIVSIRCHWVVLPVALFFCFKWQALQVPNISPSRPLGARDALPSLWQPEALPRLRSLRGAVGPPENTSWVSALRFQPQDASTVTGREAGRGRVWMSSPEEELAAVPSSSVKGSLHFLKRFKSGFWQEFYVLSPGRR